MDEITKLSADAIQRYFTTLSQFGYKGQKDIDKLIVLLFIEELLTFDFAEFVTDKDYKIIMNALYCLYGSTCLIDYPAIYNVDSLAYTKAIYTPRFSEDSNIRYTQDSKLRVEV